MASKYRSRLLHEDPHADREQSRYEKPIPSREYILTYLEQRGEPASHQQLAIELLLFDVDEQDALLRRLMAMTRSGQLLNSRRGVFGLVNKMDLIKGRVQGKREGYGFVISEDATSDLFLSHGEMRKVFDGDEVLARVSSIDSRGRREGRVVEILVRRHTQLIGRFYPEHGFGKVIPHNKSIAHEIMVPPGCQAKAQSGDFVTVKITQYPDAHHHAIGEVVEILGDVATPGLEIELAIRCHDIRFSWSQEVEHEVKGLPSKLKKTDSKGRVDLRHLPFVTIDGEDAKDFDDAVYCEASLQNNKRIGYTLYVAIADVSHYVHPSSPLDLEAQLRGTSVYFPGHVVPMLPEELSNGLCSLKPHEDRLALVCEMDFDLQGQMQCFCFYEGIIHSHARLTYTEVAGILQPPANDTEKQLQQKLEQKHASLLPHLAALYNLYKKLANARYQRGALDFDTVETRIVFSADGRINEIIPVERNDAHKLIEECMLSANVAAADLLLDAKIPALYRVHAGPSEDKLANLYLFLSSIGVGFPRHEKPSPADFQKIIKALENRPDRHLLQTQIIRSMSQAVYQPENIGHFGLGYDAYTHFTSPIRRYPDLLVHRALRYLIRNKPKQPGVFPQSGAAKLSKPDIYPYQLEGLKEFGQKCSHFERRADEATRDVISWLKCEYMQKHLGETFAGVVTSVTNFGLFVELEGIHVDGLVHISSLRNDYYHFDHETHTLQGERTGLCFKIGEPVVVVIAKVNLDERKIDLHLQSGGKYVSTRPLPQRLRHHRSSKKASFSKTKNTNKGSNPKSHSIKKDKHSASINKTNKRKIRVAKNKNQSKRKGNTRL
jgi:ribonuclease R